eukprot:g11279.t1
MPPPARGAEPPTSSPAPLHGACTDQQDSQPFLAVSPSKLVFRKRNTKQEIFVTNRLDVPIADLRIQSIVSQKRYDIEPALLKELKPGEGAKVTIKYLQSGFDPSGSAAAAQQDHSKEASSVRDFLHLKTDFFTQKVLVFLDREADVAEPRGGEKRMKESENVGEVVPGADEDEISFGPTPAANTPPARGGSHTPRASSSSRTPRRRVGSTSPRFQQEINAALRERVRSLENELKSAQHAMTRRVEDCPSDPNDSTAGDQGGGALNSKPPRPRAGELELIHLRAEVETLQSWKQYAVETDAKLTELNSEWQDFVQLRTDTDLRQLEIQNEKVLKILQLKDAEIRELQGFSTNKIGELERENLKLKAVLEGGERRQEAMLQDLQELEKVRLQEKGLLEGRVEGRATAEKLTGELDEKKKALARKIELGEGEKGKKIRGLEARIAEFEGEITRLGDLNADAAGEIKKLVVELGEKEAELRGMKTVVAAGKTPSANNGKAGAAAQAGHFLDDSVEEEQLDASTKTAAQLVFENERLTREVSRLGKQLIETQAELEEAEKLFSQKTTYIPKLEELKVIAALKSELAVAEEEKELKAGEVEELTKKLEKLRSNEEKTRSELAEKLEVFEKKSFACGETQTVDCWWAEVEELREKTIARLSADFRGEILKLEQSLHDEKVGAASLQSSFAQKLTDAKTDLEFAKKEAFETQQLYENLQQATHADSVLHEEKVSILTAKTEALERDAEMLREKLQQQRKAFVGEKEELSDQKDQAEMKLRERHAQLCEALASLDAATSSYASSPGSAVAGGKDPAKQAAGASPPLAEAAKVAPAVGAVDPGDLLRRLSELTAKQLATLKTHAATQRELKELRSSFERLAEKLSVKDKQESALKSELAVLKAGEESLKKSLQAKSKEIEEFSRGKKALEESMRKLWREKAHFETQTAKWRGETEKERVEKQELVRNHAKQLREERRRLENEAKFFTELLSLEGGGGLGSVEDAMLSAGEMKKKTGATTATPGVAKNGSSGSSSASPEQLVGQPLGSVREEDASQLLGEEKLSASASTSSLMEMSQISEIGPAAGARGTPSNPTSAGAGASATSTSRNKPPPAPRGPPPQLNTAARRSRSQGLLAAQQHKQSNSAISSRSVSPNTSANSGVFHPSARVVAKNQASLETPPRTNALRVQMDAVMLEIKNLLRERGVDPDAQRVASLYVNLANKFFASEQQRIWAELREERGRDQLARVAEQNQKPAASDETGAASNAAADSGEQTQSNHVPYLTAISDLERSLDDRSRVTEALRQHSYKLEASNAELRQLLEKERREKERLQASLSAEVAKVGSSIETARQQAEGEVLAKLGGWKDALLDRVVELKVAGNASIAIGSSPAKPKPREVEAACEEDEALQHQQAAFLAKEPMVSKDTVTTKASPTESPTDGGNDLYRTLEQQAHSSILQRHCWSLEIAVQELAEELSKQKLLASSVWQQNAVLKAQVEGNNDSSEDGGGAELEPAAGSITRLLSNLEQRQREFDEKHLYVGNPVLRGRELEQEKQKVSDLEAQAQTLSLQCEAHTLEQKRLAKCVEEAKDYGHQRLQEVEEERQRELGSVEDERRRLAESLGKTERLLDEARQRNKTQDDLLSRKLEDEKALREGIVRLELERKDLELDFERRCEKLELEKAAKLDAIATAQEREREGFDEEREELERTVEKMRLGYEETLSRYREEYDLNWKALEVLKEENEVLRREVGLMKESIAASAASEGVESSSAFEDAPSPFAGTSRGDAGCDAAAGLVDEEEDDGGEALVYTLDSGGDEGVGEAEPVEASAVANPKPSVEPKRPSKNQLKKRPQSGSGGPGGGRKRKNSAASATSKRATSSRPVSRTRSREDNLATDDHFSPRPLPSSRRRARSSSISKESFGHLEPVNIHPRSSVRRSSSFDRADRTLRLLSAPGSSTNAFLRSSISRTKRHEDQWSQTDFDHMLGDAMNSSSWMQLSPPTRYQMNENKELHGTPNYEAEVARCELEIEKLTLKLEKSEMRQKEEVAKLRESADREQEELVVRLEALLKAQRSLQEKYVSLKKAKKELEKELDGFKTAAEKDGSLAERPGTYRLEDVVHAGVVGKCTTEAAASPGAESVGMQEARGALNAVLELSEVKIGVEAESQTDFVVPLPEEDPVVPPLSAGASTGQAVDAEVQTSAVFASTTESGTQPDERVLAVVLRPAKDLSSVVDVYPDPDFALKKEAVADFLEGSSSSKIGGGAQEVVQAQRRASEIAGPLVETATAAAAPSIAEVNGLLYEVEAEKRKCAEAVHASSSSSLRLELEALRYDNVCQQDARRKLEQERGILLRELGAVQEERNKVLLTDFSKTRKGLDLPVAGALGAGGAVTAKADAAEEGGTGSKSARERQQENDEVEKQATKAATAKLKKERAASASRKKKDGETIKRLKEQSKREKERSEQLKGRVEALQAEKDTLTEKVKDLGASLKLAKTELECKRQLILSLQAGGADSVDLAGEQRGPSGMLGNGAGASAVSSAQQIQAVKSLEQCVAGLEEKLKAAEDRAKAREREVARKEELLRGLKEKEKQARERAASAEKRSEKEEEKAKRQRADLDRKEQMLRSKGNIVEDLKEEKERLEKDLEKSRTEVANLAGKAKALQSELRSAMNQRSDPVNLVHGSGHHATSSAARLQTAVSAPPSGPTSQELPKMLERFASPRREQEVATRGDVDMQVAGGGVQPEHGSTTATAAEPSHAPQQSVAKKNKKKSPVDPAQVKGDQRLKLGKKPTGTPAARLLHLDEDDDEFSNLDASADDIQQLSPVLEGGGHGEDAGKGNGADLDRAVDMEEESDSPKRVVSALHATSAGRTNSAASTLRKSHKKLATSSSAASKSSFAESARRRPGLKEENEDSSYEENPLPQRSASSGRNRPTSSHDPVEEQEVQVPRQSVSHSQQQQPGINKSANNRSSLRESEDLFGSASFNLRERLGDKFKLDAAVLDSLSILNLTLEDVPAFLHPEDSADSLQYSRDS